MHSGMFLLPYSPRWLAKQGRHEEALQTLLRLHGGMHNAKTEVVQAEFEEMLSQIKWGKCELWFFAFPYLSELRSDALGSCLSRGGKYGYQFQGFIQLPAKCPPDALWLLGSSDVSVDGSQCQVSS